MRDVLAMIQDWRMRRYFRHIGLECLEQRTRSVVSSSVRRGPFAGLRLLNRASGSVWIPKVLGSYESEVAEAVEEVMSVRPDVIIDIGCAEGYYAVGFARRLAKTKVFAADVNPIARRMVRAMAAANHVEERLFTMSWISCAGLESILIPARSPVVWCDIEGGELDLLDIGRVPELRKAWMFVEEHQHSTGVAPAALVGRFSSTHEHRIIPQSHRAAADWIPRELASVFTKDEARLAMSELRPASQVWIVFKPISTS